MTFPILPSNAAVTGFPLRSLRFNSADSAYLNRAFTTPASTTIWTISLWVKRGLLTGTYRLFGASTTTYLTFNSSDQLNLTLNGTSAATSTAVFRDPSAWYHVVYQQNGATQTIYVNSVSVATGTTAASVFNTAITHQLGAANTSNYFNGYLTEVNFIDGQALPPSSFGETNATTGQWQPKRYTGTYGTNGFYLNFSDNSGTTAATLGKDYSGNGNNWTPNNFSVTPGAGNDSMIDVPTNWADGGNGRGNYCTLNPLDHVGGTFSNGNLDVVVAATNVNIAVGNIAVSSGKWYWEVMPTSMTDAAAMIGIADASKAISDRRWTTANGWAYLGLNGEKYTNSSSAAYGATYATNDVIGVALDMDSGSVTFYKNGASQGVAYNTGLSGKSIQPMLGNGTINGSQTCVLNFGQRPFAYTPPSGFKALNTQNLPTPTIAQGNTQFNPVLYTGNGSTQSVTGLAYTPDLVWIKSRSAATDHALYDVIRGTQSRLESNTTDAQVTSDGGLTAFNSGGFSLSTLAQVNTSAATYVAWNWKANGAGVTNTAGSITSTVSANTTAGFSIVAFTAPASGICTVGHGLGVAPSMVIVKRTNAATGWWVYHSSFSDLINDYLELNSTAAKATYSTMWGTGMTSSVCGFSVGGAIPAGGSEIAYCFAAIPGYSAFGSYTGNGSADGPFVWMGFRPRFVMIKLTSGSEHWELHDTARGTYNINTPGLYANLSNAEGASQRFDVLSNGIKIRTDNTGVNASGGTYIYAAFAESPFKYSLAR